MQEGRRKSLTVSEHILESFKNSHGLSERNTLTKIIELQKQIDGTATDQPSQKKNESPCNKIFTSLTGKEDK